MDSIKKFSKHRIADLLITIGLFFLVLSYLANSWYASSHILNLIMVAPVAILALILCGLLFIKQIAIKISPQQIDTEQTEQNQEPITAALPIIGLFSLYTLSLPFLGFDVGSLLFIAAYLVMKGERNGLRIIIYALFFAFSVSLFFSNMLPYPMPMMILPTAY